MFFFSRKSKDLPKAAWDQAKYEYEAAIQRCYQRKHVTLALCSFQKFLAFSFQYPAASERKPFVETDFIFRGVVHERGQFETHVRCEVEILPDATPEDHIGEFVLSNLLMDNDKARREQRFLELKVRLSDPTSMLKSSLIGGLRDAASSGLRFMHIELECQESTKEEVEKALSDMREQGYAATRDVLGLKMWPKIELQEAPAWARQTV